MAHLDKKRLKIEPIKAVIVKAKIGKNIFSSNLLSRGKR